MRQLIEAVLLAGGIFMAALGLHYMGDAAVGPAEAAALTAAGGAALLLGAVLTLRLKPVKAPELPPGRVVHAPLSEPLAVVHLSWNGLTAPVILGASANAAVLVDDNGLVHVSLRRGRAGRPMVCRADRAAAYFNTLKRGLSEAAVKLVNPVEGQIRLEFWDEAAISGDFAAVRRRF